jgi:hypothetical protein
VGAQEVERGVGQRHVAILAALAMDVEQLAIAVDVRDLEAGAFHQTESAGVDGGEADAVDGDPDHAENAPDLVAAQHHGELLLALGSRHVEDGPWARERLLVEELDPAEGDGVGAAGDLLDGGQVEQVLAHVLLAQQIWRRPMESGELGDGADVGLHGAVGQAAQLEILDHALAQGRHGVLSGKGSWRGSDIAALSGSTHRSRPHRPPGGAIRRRRIEFSNRLQQTAELWCARLARTITLGSS